MDQQTHLSYLSLAQQARERAYAPYSRYRVGACAVDDQGRYALGCNVENASYGATLCAERNAIAAAVAAGLGRIVAVYIAAEGGVTPCGICRQVLMEANPDMTVYAKDDGAGVRSFALRALLPHAFTGDNLA